MDPRQRLAHWTQILGADALVPGRRSAEAGAEATPGGTSRRPALAATEPDPGAKASRARPNQGDRPPAQPAQGASAASPAAKLDPSARLARLEELRVQAARCESCGLCEGRTKSVFADGDPKARIAFVGEGPGADEDRTGVPFVGRAGQLLTKIIERAMGMPRESVYIANIVKCRPPGNRNPSPEEQAACAPFLREQLALVEPDLVITLGKVATQYLLGQEGAMSRFRGRVHRVGKLEILPTWHPAYLLRTPAAKAQTWEDIKTALRHLGLPENPKPHGA